MAWRRHRGVEVVGDGRCSHVVDSTDGCFWGPWHRRWFFFIHPSVPPWSWSNPMAVETLACWRRWWFGMWSRTKKRKGGGRKSSEERSFWSPVMRRSSDRCSIALYQWPSSWRGTGGVDSRRGVAALAFPPSSLCFYFVGRKETQNGFWVLDFNLKSKIQKPKIPFIR